MEIQVSNSASDALKQKIKETGNNSAVRVFIAGIGWGGPNYRIALDEPKKSDSVYEVDGLKILLDKDLSTNAKGISVDYKNSIFGNRFLVEEMYSTNSCR